MDKKTKVFSVCGYFYIVLPILIFFIGWCSLPVSIFGSLILIISLYFTCKNAPALWMPNTKKQYFFILSIFFITVLWVYLSGIGALVFQNFDHTCRNPIFEMLVQNSWPVMHIEKPAMLVYYIGFWLPSAFIGKIFNSVQIGYYFQIFWATTGIFLFFYNVLNTVNKKTYLPIFVFIFFSGLDVLGTLLLGKVSLATNLLSHLEWWFPGFQFSSMTTQLFWVFNQAICAWLLTVMCFNEKNNKNLLFLYACLFIHSPLPALGMFPFIFYWCIKNNNKKCIKNYNCSEIKNIILSLLTFQNTIGFITVFMISYFYLSGNIAGGNYGLISINFLFFLFWLFTFFLLEAGIYLLPLFKIYKNDTIYYIVFSCLLIYPFVQVGFSSDFCMRATISPLVILYLLIVKYLDTQELSKKCTKLTIFLMIILFIGSATPLHEFNRTICYTNLGITKAQSNLGFENFFGWTENNKFLKYFGKKIKN